MEEEHTLLLFFESKLDLGTIVFEKKYAHAEDHTTVEKKALFFSSKL